MARVTVEDCLDNVDNRFQLVLVATRRARQLIAGAEPCVSKGNDKPTVLALREIAGGFVTNALATATLCFCPPEIWSGYLSFCSIIPTASKRAVTLFFLSDAGALWTIRSGYSMFS